MSGPKTSSYSVVYNAALERSRKVEAQQRCDTAMTEYRSAATGFETACSEWPEHDFGTTAQPGARPAANDNSSQWNTYASSIEQAARQLRTTAERGRVEAQRQLDQARQRSERATILVRAACTDLDSTRDAFVEHSFMATPSTAPPPTGSRSANEWNRHAQAQESQVREVETHLAAEVPTARRNAMANSLTVATTSELVTARKALEDAGALPIDLATELAKTMARVLGRLRPDASAEVRTDLEEMAHGAATADRDFDRNALELALRQRVQDENDRLSRSDAMREEAEKLLISLQGLAGSEIEKRRDRLQAVAAGNRELTDRDRRKIEKARAAAIDEAHRQYTQDTLMAGLAELGLRVDERIETAVAERKQREGSADGPVERFLAKESWRGHAVRVRFLADGRLHFRVIKTEEAETTAAQDTDIEADWCGSFDALVDQATAAGIDLETLVRREPGQDEMELVIVDRQAYELKRALERQQGAPRQRRIGDN